MAMVKYLKNNSKLSFSKLSKLSKTNLENPNDLINCN